MTALTQDRNTPRQDGEVYKQALAAVKVFAGSLLMRNATGYLTKGQTALGLIGAGVALERVDNSAGAAGDLSVSFRRSEPFRFANSASTDQITIADIGKVAYAVDDQTVAKTNGRDGVTGLGTRSAAGIIVDVDTLGVWILVDEEKTRAVLAGSRSFVPVRVATLVGTGVYRVLSPFAGKVAAIWSIIEGVLTTGDATLTGKIGGVAITAGVVTITQVGSAAGDKDFAIPTAANTVAVGDELSLTVGGTNATATVANCLFEIERA